MRSYIMNISYKATKFLLNVNRSHDHYPPCFEVASASNLQSIVCTWLPKHGRAKHCYTNRGSKARYVPKPQSLQFFKTSCCRCYHGIPSFCLAPLVPRFPKDIIQHYLMQELAKDFTRTKYLFFFRDLLQFSATMIVTSSPDLAIQACQLHDLLIKPPVLKAFFEPFSDIEDPLTMNGPQ